MQRKYGKTLKKLGEYYDLYMESDTLCDMNLIQLTFS